MSPRKDLSTKDNPENAQPLQLQLEHCSLETLKLSISHRQFDELLNDPVQLGELNCRLFGGLFGES